MQETDIKQTDSTTARAQQDADKLVKYIEEHEGLHEHLDVLKGLRDDLYSGRDPSTYTAPDFDPKVAVQDYLELITGPKSAFEVALDKGIEHDATV